MNTYGDQIELEKHKLGCIQQEVCIMSYMHPKQNIKIIDWLMKIDPPIRITADFGCMNIPIDVGFTDSSLFEHDDKKLTQLRTLRVTLAPPIKSCF